MFLPFAAAGPASAAESSKSFKPNIIFVLADDLGIDGVSCYGDDKHQTPHIDALAAIRPPLHTPATRPPCAARGAAC